MKQSTLKRKMLFKVNNYSPITKPQTQFDYKLFKSYMNHNDFDSFLTTLQTYLPQIQIEHPELLFAVYQSWLMLFKAKGMNKEYESMYSKYFLPFCLQFPNQMRLMKSKQLFSFLNNCQTIINDQAKLKTKVDQYVNRILLLLIYLRDTNKTLNPQEKESQKEKIKNEVFSLNILEREIIQLFIINDIVFNTIKEISYSTNEKRKTPRFEKNIFNQLQQDAMFYPLSKVEVINWDNERYLPTDSLSQNDADAHDSYSIYSILNKRPLRNKYNRKTKEVKYDNPLLKYFHPKDLRKEEIDKKVFRAFRACIKEFMSQTPNYFKLLDKIFWKDFVDKKLLPPMKYIENNNKMVEFKSFSSAYFVWLFSKKGTCKLFNAFVNSQEEKLLKFLSQSPHMKKLKDQEALDKIQYYIRHIPCIYSPKWIEDGEFIVCICTCVDYRFEFDKILCCEEENPQTNQSTNTLQLNHPDFDNNADVFVEKEGDRSENQIAKPQSNVNNLNDYKGLVNCDDINSNCSNEDKIMELININTNMNYSLLVNNQMKYKDQETFCSDNKFVF